MNIFVRDMICYAAADVLALVRIILHLQMEIIFLLIMINNLTLDFPGKYKQHA